MIPFWLDTQTAELDHCHRRRSGGSQLYWRQRRRRQETTQGDPTITTKEREGGRDSLRAESSLQYFPPGTRPMSADHPDQRPEQNPAVAAQRPRKPQRIRHRAWPRLVPPDEAPPPGLHLRPPSARIETGRRGPRPSCDGPRASLRPPLNSRKLPSQGPLPTPARPPKRA